MNIRSEKGFSGIDIVISLLVVFIFITIVSFLSYYMNSETKEIELKSQALEICVQQIELMKQVDFDDIKDLGIEEKDEYTGEVLTSVSVPEGFTRTVTIEDYKHINNNALSGYVKKITVEISYKYQKENKKIELSTLVTK